MIMNLLRIRGLKNFAAIFSVFFLAASLGFGVPATTPLVVQIVGDGTLSPNYTNGQPLNVGQSYSVTAKAKSSFTFNGWSGSQTSSKPKLTFVMAAGETITASFVDKQKPTLTIKAPPSSTALTNPTVVVTGTAKDNDAVANVFCNLNGEGWQAASTGNGWSNWWVNLTLSPNLNVLQAYAVDRSGNCSKTNQLKMTYSAAPATLGGMALAVAGSGQTTFVFGSGTFSEEIGVGSYTYKKTGPVSGRLVLKYAAPPTGPANDTATLQFSSASDGTFTDAGGTSYGFSLSTAANLALTAVTGAEILFSGDDADQVLLNFLTPPQVVDNGSMFNVANPLIISLSAQYPGETGDRVAVTFTHLVNQSGTWVTVAPKIYAGTVIDFDTSANTVTVLFDKPSFISKTDLYGPTAGLPLNILTYYYTDDSVTNGTGTFIYTNYSPAGSLLQSSVGSTNTYYILTFTNVSGTDTADAGTFYSETYGANGGFQTNNSGTFAIAAPPVITSQPALQAVTNGGTANFYVTATGSQPLTYQWQLNGVGLADGTNGWGSIVSGSSTTNLTITDAATNDIGSYTVVIVNGFGGVTSSAATLSVTLSPVITTQPQSQVVTNGATARFDVVASGVPTLTYQWQFNGTNMTDGTPIWSSSLINGALTANLNISFVTTNDLGNYQVIVNNSFGSVTSSPAATLTFSNSAPTP